MLAVFIVDTLLDSATGICGPDGTGNSGCSLRSAIIAANNNPGADSITLPAGTYELSLPPVLGEENGDLEITDDLTITGSPADPTQTVVDAKQIDRVFSISTFGPVATPLNVIFSGLTIQGGLSPQGLPAGGIDADANTILELRNSIVQGNRVDSSIFDSGDADGGGIATSGNLILNNTTVTNNFAQDFGGGIAFFDDATITIIDSTISNNQSGGQGGGIWAANLSDYQISITRTNFTGNQSVNSEGGGLFVEGSGSGSVNLDQVNFSGNQSAAGGGGAYVSQVSTFTQTGGTYDQNTTGDAGGGLLVDANGSVNVDGTTFTSNTAVNGGGGAALYTAATFRNTLFQQNAVTGSPTPGVVRFDLGGGGIAAAQQSSVRPLIRIEDSTIANNTAALAAGIGAANSFVEIVNSTIEGNQATGNVGGGGGIGFAQDDVSGVISDRVRLTIQNSTISNNTSDSEAGGIGIADADAEITDSTITGNTASGNAASGGRAGGIGMIGFANSPTLRLDRTTIDNNTAASDGGGLAFQNAGFVMLNTTISDNVANGNGGGIAFANADPTLSGFIEFSTIATNRVDGGFGSNVAVNGSVTTFLSSIVADPQGTQPIINMVSGGPGELSSRGFNLFSDSNFSNPMPSDLLGVDPLLGPLADNGGAVRTRALLAGSPAIDAGAGSSLAVDARGALRPIDGDGDTIAVNDIGAFEAPQGTAANAPPTISDIADVTINQGDDTGATSFTVGDAETAAGSLIVTATSSNTTLVPDANIIFGGSGANRTVTVTPVADQSGNATITVTVSDGTLTASDNFVLTVTPAPANTPPTISDIADVTIDQGTNTGAISFTVGDAETPAANLIVTATSSNTTLVPNANIVVGDAGTPAANLTVTAVSSNTTLVPSANVVVGSGTDRTVTVTPVADQSGSATITVTVSDGTLTASDTFVLTVDAAIANAPPIAGDDFVNALPGVEFSIPFSILLANDSAGPANEPQELTITAVTQPTDGMVALNSFDLTYTPPAGFSGTTSFTYTVVDSEGLSATAVVTVVVPSFTGLMPISDRIPGNVGEVVQFNVSDLLSNDVLGGASGSPGIEFVDQFGVPVATTTIQTDAGGNLTLSGSSLTYTPPSKFFGNDKFRYRISDGNGVSATFATVTINVISAAALAAELLGDSRITISNARIVGGDGGHGFFVNGASEGLPIDRGIILSTGFVGRALGPNQEFESFPQILDAQGDADLAALLVSPDGSQPDTFDASILEFDFTVPIASRISFEYIFVSNEYNEFVDDIFNDVLAFFLDGQNIATVPGTSTPVAINNINLLRNSQFFNDNETANQFQTSFDGFTTVLEAASGVLIPGQTYRLKLAITDVADAVVDSALLLRAKSFGIGEADLSVSATQNPASVPPGGNVTYRFDVVNNGPGVSTNTTFASALPLGATLVSATSTGGTLTTTAGGLTVDLADMAVGQAVTIQVVVTAPNTEAELTIQASISASQLDPMFSNNSVNLTTIVGDGLGGLIGQISCDANGNGEPDPNEGVPSATVFIDQNGNRLLDSDERSATTDSLGSYRFTGLNTASGEKLNVVVQNPPSCVAIAPEIGVTRSMMSTGSLSRAIIATDLDGDGHNDLLVVNELGNDISVLLNNGISGGFSSGQSILVGKRPVAIAAWKPQGSPAPVIAVAAVGTTANKGSIYVIEGGQVTRELSAGNGPIAVAVNDFNGDGQADFIAATLRSGTIVAQMSGESGERVLATARSPKSVTAANLNGDAFVDLVVVSYGYEGDNNSSEVIALLGDGQGGFSLIERIISGRTVDVAVANFDADSLDELVIVSYSGLLRIFDFSADGFAQVDSVATESGDGVEAIAAADVNQDGRADLVIANSKMETIELFINQGSGFVRNRIITGVPSPSDVVIANLDGDRILDIAVSNLYGSVKPGFVFPSAATILGLTVAEREIVLTSSNVTQNFGFRGTPLTPLSAAAMSNRSFDVDRNGTVSPRDALLVVNAVSRTHRAEGESSSSKASYKLDVNRDGQVTALDALLVINHLSRLRRAALAANPLLPSPADTELSRRQQATDALMSNSADLF